MINYGNILFDQQEILIHKKILVHRHFSLKVKKSRELTSN